GVLISLVLAIYIVPAGATTRTQGNPNFEHIFYIMMENHQTSQIIGNTADAPYISKLAQQSAVAMNYYGVTHPSLPNYLAAISGSFEGIWDDCAAGATVTCAPEELGPSLGYTDGEELVKPCEIAGTTKVTPWYSG